MPEAGNTDRQHYDPLHDPARLSAVSTVLRLDPRTEAALTRLVTLAARTLGAPVGQVNVITDDRQFSIISTGPGRWNAPQDVPLASSYCRHVVHGGDAVILSDAREHPTFRDNGATTDAGVVAYIGVPLRVEPDLVIGTMCVVDFEPRQWREEEVELVQQLGQFAMAEIERRGVSEAEVTRLMNVVENTYDAIVSVDTDGLIREWNPGAERLLGYTRAEIAGRSALTLVPPEDHERLAGSIEKVRRGESLPRMEAQRLRRDGTRVTVSIVVTPITDLAGRVAGATAVMRDISERVANDARLREREAHFRALIENSGEVITLLERNGTIRYDSPSVERVLGYGDSERLGDGVFGYVHPDDLSAVQAAFARCIGSRVPATVEARVRHRDGSWRALAATGMDLLDEPAVGAIVVNSRDITEMRRAEEQLRHAQKMEAVGRLAGGVAHDFNNILTAVSGNAHILLDQLEPQSPSRQEAEEIVRAAARATDLTRQLLAFSRKQFMEPRITDPGHVVTSANRMLTRLLSADIDLVFEIEEDAGLVFADPGQLEQVILNLVVNARDAMPDGGRVHVEVRRRTIEARVDSEGDIPAGSYVMIAVSDTGEGMSKEVQQHIFEPFFTTKAVDRGTGLGLSTVYGIVRQNGGFVSVYSEPGQGSVFRVYLPQVEGATPAGEPQAADTPVADGGGETILLVEDDSSVRKLARRVLERYGYVVIEADGALDALERVVPEHGLAAFDLLISDVVMPGMSGPELTRRLRAGNDRLQALLMSGYTEDEVVRRGTDARGHFIEKPFTPESLARKVRQVLDMRQAPR